MLGNSDKYNKLNSVYLFLWECLDEFFEAGRWLSGERPRIPEIRIRAKQLSMIRELTSLKGVEMEELRLINHPEVKQNAVRRFREVIDTIPKKLESDFEELERLGATNEELADAKQDMKRLLVLVSDYAELSSDATPWVQRALDLKNEFGRKALEYADKLTE